MSGIETYWKISRFLLVPQIWWVPPGKTSLEYKKMTWLMGFPWWIVIVPRRLWAFFDHLKSATKTYFSRIFHIQMML
jgi:hypothetical protein